MLRLSDRDERFLYGFVPGLTRMHPIRRVGAPHPRDWEQGVWAGRGRRLVSFYVLTYNKLFWWKAIFVHDIRIVRCERLKYRVKNFGTFFLNDLCPPGKCLWFSLQCAIVNRIVNVLSLQTNIGTSRKVQVSDTDQTDSNAGTPSSGRGAALRGAGAHPLERAGRESDKRVQVGLFLCTSLTLNLYVEKQR